MTLQKRTLGCAELPQSKWKCSILVKGICAGGEPATPSEFLAGWVKGKVCFCIRIFRLEIGDMRAIVLPAVSGNPLCG